MIYIPHKIETEYVIIRFFMYQDPYKGWGDAGTAFYVNIPVSELEMEKLNHVYQYRVPNTMYYQIFNSKSIDMMDCGYELSSEEKRLAEEKELKEKLKRTMLFEYPIDFE